MQRQLASAGVGTAVYYPLPLHRQACFADVARDARCPVADEAAATSLALPVFAALQEAELSYVLESLRSALSPRG